MSSCDPLLCRKETAHWQHAYCTSWADFLEEGKKKIFSNVWSEIGVDEKQQGQTGDYIALSMCSVFSARAL